MQYGPENRPYQPHGRAKDLWNFRGDEIILAGPAGTGKSRNCLELGNYLCEKYPGARGLILRKTRSSLTSTALVTFEEEVIPRGHPILGGPTREHRSIYRYPNGSEIVIGGMDDPTKIMSSQYDWIYVQEAIELTEDDWEQPITRLRNGKVPREFLMGDTNPGHPTHWILKRRDRGGVTVIDTLHQDNPVYYDEAKGEWTERGRKYLEKLQRLTGHRLERFLKGKWVAAEGSRWPMLDEKVHRFKFWDRFPNGIPNGYRLIMGKDWGKRNPFCALWFAIDFDGNIWCYREVYETEKAPDEQAQMCIDRTGANERIKTIYADPDIWNRRDIQLDPKKPRNPSVYEYWSEIYSQDERFGDLIPGYNESRQTAMSTLDLLFGRGNGHPNLFIEESCENFWNELTGAVWSTPPLNARGPLKEDIEGPDHAITASYYALHTWLQAPEDISEVLPDHKTILEAHYEQVEYDRAIRERFIPKRRARV